MHIVYMIDQAENTGVCQLFDKENCVWKIGTRSTFKSERMHQSLSLSKSLSRLNRIWMDVQCNPLPSSLVIDAIYAEEVG